MPEGTKFSPGAKVSTSPVKDFLDFSPENEVTGFDDLLCAAKDTVPIGAALYGAGKYKFKLLTTFAYGTYRGSKLAESNGYAFDPFVYLKRFFAERRFDVVHTHTKLRFRG